MINYRKSLLSLATILAIGSTAANADYIPLSLDNSNTKPWVLFGVNGFVSEGASTATSTAAATFSITDSTENTAKDLKKDDIYGGDDGVAANGLKFEKSGSLGKVKAITVSTLQVRVDMANITYSERDPERTIYVTFEEAGSPAFAMKYKASLEGQIAQVSTMTDGSNAYTFVINSENTYNNPVVATLIEASSGGADADGTYLKSLEDVVDYDFSNNPKSLVYYDKTTHQKTDSNSENLRIYSYDAKQTLWKLYDSQNAAAANDFSELEKSKAYWARLDDNGRDKEAGLVLGSGTLTTQDYTDAGITTGWNLLSFDDTHPDLRVSTTGITFELHDNTKAITLTDATGKHSITTDDLDNSDYSHTVADCKIINQAIKDAKIAGTLPDTFHLKAFPIAVAKIALISNKRFVLKEEDSDHITAVKTLAGKQPLNATTLVDHVLDDDFSANGVLSKYGEYAMIIEPLIGPDVAASLDDANDIDTASLYIKSTVAGSFKAIVTMDDDDEFAVSMPVTVGNISGADPKVTATEIDIEYSTDTNHILVAATEPFYIRDHTFTRVFKYTDTDIEGKATVFSNGTGDVEGTLAAGTDTVAAAATVFDNLVGVESAADGDGNVVIVVDAENGNEFYVTETVTTDHLTDAVSTKDLAKGAVKGVYSLNYLAKRPLENIVTIDQDTVSDEAGDTIGFTLNGGAASAEVNPGTFDEANNDSVALFFTALVDQLTTQLKNEKIVATVTTNAGSGTALADAIITITGPDITDATIQTTDGGGGGGAALANGATDKTDIGHLSTISPDLAADLQYNAIYSPDYVTEGPLYTLRDLGYRAKSMVTGTMQMTANGTISWESLDLTRAPSAWLDSQDYNLFSVDASSGYWVYLEESPEATITVTNPSFQPNYKHHFNADKSTYNSVSGNLAVEVTGLDDSDSRASARVNAYLAGTTVELSRTGLSNVYTGKISSNDISDLTTGSEYEIFTNVADGLGSNLKNFSTDLKVDYKKPEAPTMTITDGSFSLTSTSADVTSFYVFKDLIDEQSTVSSDDFLVRLLTADAAAYSLCSKLAAKSSVNDDPYTLRAFAMDGTGTLGGGNVSDITEKVYMPMLKSATFMTNTHDGSDSSTPSTFASASTIVYNASCEAVDNDTNYGVTLTSETSFTTVKLAFTHVENRDTTAVPLTMFIEKGDNALASISYPETYAGEKVYVEVGSTIYALVLRTEAELDVAGGGAASDDAYALTTTADEVKQLPTGISF